MIFKTLVECLLKQIRDPDDGVTLNALHTLLREMKRDLTHAFLMSAPLMEKHTTLFWQSRSFLDFIIQISNLPSHHDFCKTTHSSYTCKAQQTHSNHTCSAQQTEEMMEKKSCLNDEQDNLKACYRKLDECEKQKNELLTELESCERTLKLCQENEVSLNKKNYQDQKTWKNKEEELYDQLETCKLEKKEIIEKLDSCLNANETLVQYSKELIENMNTIIAQKENLEKYIDYLRLDGNTLLDKQQKLFEYIRDLEEQKNRLEANHRILVTSIEERNKIPSICIHEESSDESSSERNKNIKSLAWEESLTYKLQALEDCEEENSALQKSLNECNEEKRYLENQLKDCENEKKQFQEELEKCKTKNFNNKQMTFQDYDSQNQQDSSTSFPELNKSHDGSNNSQEVPDTNVQKILKHLTDHYQITICENLFHHLVNDLNELQVFQKQLKRLRDEAHQIQIEPFLFADAVLKIYNDIPKNIITLNQIAKELHSPVDEALALDILKRLKEHASIQTLTNPSQLHFHLQRLKTIVENNYTVPCDDKDWFEKGLLHIETTKHKFEVNDRLINCLMQLTPDLLENNHPNKCEWKTKFVERYKLLEKTAKSLHGTKPVNTLNSILEHFNDNAKEFRDEDNWLFCYIHKLEETFNHSPEYKCKIKRTLHPYENDTLLKQCENVAKHFNIPFQKKSFYNDIVSFLQNHRANSLAFEKLKQDLNKYFTTFINISSIVTYIQGVFNNVLTQNNIPVKHPVCPNSTFQTHVEFYLSAAIQDSVKKVDTDWTRYYNEWLSELNLNADTPKTQFASKILLIKDQNEQWFHLYKQWLEELNFECTTPKENFLQKLKLYKTRDKRKVESFEASSEKKLKLADNYTEIEIKNLFFALYKEYFTLKWNHLKNNLPNQDEIIVKLKQKLKILEDLKPSREGTLFKLCLKYVKLDLAVWTYETNIFLENITSVDSLLKKCMMETEEYLLRMIKENKS